MPERKKKSQVFIEVVMLTLAGMERPELTALKLIEEKNIQSTALCCKVCSWIILKQDQGDR